MAWIKGEENWERVKEGEGEEGEKGRGGEGGGRGGERERRIKQVKGELEERSR